MGFGKRKEERFINEQKTLRQRRQRVEKKRRERGGEGLGSVEELWVNKARGGEEERDS